MNQPSNFLFIGGTRDGARLPVPGNDLILEMPLHGSRAVRKGAPVPTEIYVRKRLKGETEAFDFYALKEISENSIVRALIENYPAQTARASINERRKEP